MSHVRVLYFIMKKCLKTKNSQLDRTAEAPWCVFYARNEGYVMEYIPRTIICPKCGRKVGMYDGRSTINPERKCEKCKKVVVYDVETCKSTLKPLPGRMSASGMRFI